MRPGDYLRAKNHIRRGTTEWFDFCSYYGYIADNLKHMPLVIEAFAEFLRLSKQIECA